MASYGGMRYKTTKHIVHGPGNSWSSSALVIEEMFLTETEVIANECTNAASIEDLSL